MENDFKILSRQDFKTIAFSCAITLSLFAGLFFIPMLWGATEANRFLAVLFASTVWICLMAPVFSAGATGSWPALARAGVYCDTTAVFLLLCCVFVEQLTLVAVFKIYLIHLCMVFFGWVCVGSFKLRAYRYCAAMGVSVGMFVFIASPFWVSGILRFLNESVACNAATLLVRFNPMYGVLSSVGDKFEFVWHYAGVMYRITSLGQDIPVGSTHWYYPVIFMILLSILVAGIRLVPGGRVHSE